MSLSLAALRETAFARAQALGYPQRRTESYRYLNLKALRETAWVPAGGATAEQLQAARVLVRDHALPGREVFVFWNGQFVRELSLVADVAELSPVEWASSIEGVTAKTLVVDYFDSMNESRWGGGVRLRVAEGAKRQVQLLYISQSVGGATWAPSQTLVEVAEGADVDVFEQHVSGPVNAGLRNPCWAQPEVRVNVATGARLQWTQWQNLSAADFMVQRSRFVVAARAQVRVLHIAAGGALARQNVDYHVNGEGADVTLNGISLVGPGQTVDFHTLVDHAVGGSQTRQLYKGILGSDAQAVFNGRVVIQKNAQKASSEQLNQNLLLSDRSEIDSKPELEIFADDVKATHGSAIGQLNDDEVFYLRSRGIPRAQAQEMIALGSVVGLVDELDGDELKQSLTRALGVAYRRIHE
ncbi:MAG: Fe-S cluster assembly protein SufD [Bdellovibrionaceae bacterium]|nr:Fe-S cluster assembly protein SufD [Pseudobdellovibrionaceae bacterium]